MLALIAGLAALIGAVEPATARPKRTDPAAAVTTELVAELPSAFVDRFVTGLALAGREGSLAAPDTTIWFAPDGMHLAFVHPSPTGVSVYVDGVPGREYQHVAGFTFSPEGGHFAYLAGPFARGDLAVVHDGHEFAVDPGVEIGSSLQMSGDGSRFGYVGISRSQFRPATMCIVTDRGRSREYESVSVPRFAWNGKHEGFLARRFGRYLVVIDGVESRESVGAGEPVFDVEGRHTMFVDYESARYGLHRDGELVQGYEGIGPDFVTDRDGSRIGYVVETRSGQRLAIDGEVGDAWNAVAFDTTLFGPASERVAYWGQRGGTWTLVIDRYAVLERPAGLGPTRVYLDRDRAHVALIERQPIGSRVLFDGRPGFDWDAVGEPRVAPRGGRFAYVARRGDRARVVVDGAEGPELVSAGDPTWSPDGAHVAYLGWRSRDRACAFVDGVAGPEFDAIVPGGPQALADGTFEYLAIRGTRLLRVRQIPSGTPAPGDGASRAPASPRPDPAGSDIHR